MSSWKCFVPHLTGALRQIFFEATITQAQRERVSFCDVLKWECWLKCYRVLFSLSFSILAVFFLMAACHLPCRRPLACLMHLQRHPVFRFAPCSLDALADAIGVLATRFRMIFRRLLSSGHRLCLSGWVVVAALVGSPCWIVVATLNWESCVLSRPLAALARATVTLGSVLPWTKINRDSLGRQVRILAFPICQKPPCAVGNHSLCGSRHPELTALRKASQHVVRGWSSKRTYLC